MFELTAEGGRKGSSESKHDFKFQMTHLIGTRPPATCSAFHLEIMPVAVELIRYSVIGSITLALTTHLVPSKLVKI